jgi:hypothetical protein
MGDESNLIDAVRGACIEAAIAAYEDAGIRGLCLEGRWECAVEAMRRADLKGAAAARDVSPASKRQT